MSPFGYYTSSVHQWGEISLSNFVEEVSELGDVEGPARVPDLLSGPVGLKSKGHEYKSFSVPPCSDQSLGDKPTQHNHSHFRAGNPVEPSSLLHFSGQPAIVFNFMASGTQSAIISQASRWEWLSRLDVNIAEWALASHLPSVHLTKRNSSKEWSQSQCQVQVCFSPAPSLFLLLKVRQ